MAGAFINVTGNNKNGINGLQFNWGIMRHSVPVDPSRHFDQIDLLLENEEIISLKSNEPSEFLPNATVYFSYKVYDIEDDTTWVKLKTIPVKKIRISSENKELFTLDIETNYSNSIQNVIKCVDALGIVKP